MTYDPTMTPKQAEESKISLRNIRRDAWEDLKAQEKNKTLTEDELKRLQDELQKSTDHFTKIVDQLIQEKEAEIMKI